MEVEPFSAAQAFFFITRGSPFWVTRSLSVRLRLRGIASVELSDKDMVWIDMMDGWMDVRIIGCQKNFLIFVLDTVQSFAGSGH